MSIRLLVAAYDRVLREGVVSMITGTEIELACQAVDADQAIRFALTVDPDVILFDTELLGADGYTTLKQMKRECPRTSVIMFSGSENLAHMSQARELKADGFLPKLASREEILEAIRKVAQGKDAWSRRQLRKISNTSTRREVIADEEIPLTVREREVLAKIVEGLINQEIADELGVNIETVKDHVKHILAKIVVEDRTQAALWAVGNNLV